MLARLRSPLLFAVVFALLVSIGTTQAGASPPPLTVTSFSATAPSTTPHSLELHGSDVANYPIFFQLGTPAHGSVQLEGTATCASNGAGGVDCTQDATYTSNSGYVGPDSFQYGAGDNHGNTTPNPGLVSVTVTSNAPVITTPAVATTGIAWAGSASNVRTSATVNWGDGSAPASLSPADDGTVSLIHTWTAAGTFTLTITNPGSAGTVVGTASVTVSALPAASAPASPTPIPVNDGPVPPQVVSAGTDTTVVVGSSPITTNTGLRIQVGGGAVMVVEPGLGQSTIRTGQFGYTPGFTQPPVILPSNPGIQFTPPPVFGSSTSSSGVVVGTQIIQLTPTSNATPPTVVTAGFPTTDTKKLYCDSVGSVDCQVRGKRPVTNAPVTGTVSVHRFAASSPKTPINPPVLIYLRTNGTWAAVTSSTNHTGAVGYDPHTGLVTATFDSTSTPSLASLATATTFAEIQPAVVRGRDALQKTHAPRAVAWPRASASVDTGEAFSCPYAAIRACTVTLAAASAQLGVNRIVGARTLAIKPGTTAALTFPLARPGRWRLAGGQLHAVLAISVRASLPKPVAEQRLVNLRVPLPG